MKKFILLGIALILGIASTYAQGSFQLSPTTGDIIINTGVITKNFTITTGSNGVVIQASYVVNSGTGGGTAQLSGSVDNVNFINIQAAYTITASTPQANIWYVTAPVPPYLRIVYTGAATENTTVKTWVRAPKYQPTP